jgi:hypothetical protein
MINLLCLDSIVLDDSYKQQIVEMGLSYFCCYIWDKGAIRDNGANELK